jgi:hypothetical protein
MLSGNGNALEVKNCSLVWNMIELALAKSPARTACEQVASIRNKRRPRVLSEWLGDTSTMHFHIACMRRCAIFENSHPL